MHWLRRRMGGAGRPCLRIRERVGECLPQLREDGNDDLGLSASELSAFSEMNKLEEIGQHFPWRGTAQRLETIAWWGSAVGDIACRRRPFERSQILCEAAGFNLGISLFDSILEHEPSKSPYLIEVLNEAHLKERMRDPLEADTQLICDDPTLDLLVQLFDRALSSIGQRFAASVRQIDYLSELLQEMYRSELGLSNDRFAAKSLPIVFIGTWANPNEDERAFCFFDALGCFMRLWDDWLDITDDVRNLAPNSFIGAPSSLASFDALGYFARFLARAIGGTLFHKGVSNALCDALKKSLSAASCWDHQAYRKTVQLFRVLLH
jgi:hypothetical protein